MNLENKLFKSLYKTMVGGVLIFSLGMAKEVFAQELTEVDVLTKENTDKASPFILTPFNLKDLVLRGNLNLMQAFMRVKQAEDRLNKSRLDLLPSINVGAALSGPSGLGAQAMSTLPFLLPSNWYRLSVNKNLREAEMLGLKSLALNTVLNAEKCYFTLLRDQKVLELLSGHKQRLLDLGNKYEQRNILQGKIDPVGLNLISGKSHSVESAIQKNRELVTVEKATLNRMLAQRENFAVLQKYTLPTKFDAMTAGQLWNYLTNKGSTAPEMQQLQWLVKASKNAKWAQVFSFLGATGMSVSSDNGFGQLASSGTVNLGFGMIPLFSLANHQVREFELQQQELAEEGWRIIQTAAAALQYSKQQFETLEQAVFDYEELYRLALNRMERDEADLMLPLNALQMVLESKIQLSDARLSLDHARLQIMRIMREDLFQDVHVNVPQIN